LSEESVDKAAAERVIYKALILKTRLGWLGPVSSIGGVVTSFWLIYAAYSARGVLAATLALIFMSICYGAGPAFMFAVASTFLCFLLKQVGVWLPVTAYVLAAITLYVTVHVMRAQRITNPHNL
jgi:hypothetical protein